MEQSCEFAVAVGHEARGVGLRAALGVAERLDHLAQGEEALVDLARLLIRYEGFPGASDLMEDMNKVLNLWGLSRKSLNIKTKKIWEEGYRPGTSVDETVGSSFDTSDLAGN